MKLKDIKPGQCFSYCGVSFFIMLEAAGWISVMNSKDMNIGWVAIRLPKLELAMFDADDPDEYDCVNPEDVP